jgi:hypothetical protein
VQLAEERLTVQRLKQKQASSPNRVPPLSSTSLVSPLQEVKSTSIGRLASPARKVTKPTAGRQPLHQQALATTSTATSRTATQNVGIVYAENDLEEDFEQDLPEEQERIAAPSVALKRKMKAARETPEPYEDGEEVQEYAVKETDPPLVKKKTGILKRARKAAGSVPSAKTPAESKAKDSRKAKKQAEEVDMDMLRTPLVPTKKRNTKVETLITAEEEEEEEEGDGEAPYSDTEATPIVPAKSATATKNKAKTKQSQTPLDVGEAVSKTPLLRKKRSGADDQEEVAVASTLTSRDPEGKVEKVVAVEKKKKRRLMKQTTNIANNFMNCNGDTSGDLNPGLNLPLQLSPIKGDPSSSSNHHPTLGIRSAAAASRLFGR